MNKKFSSSIGNIVVVIVFVLFSLWAGRGLFKYSVYSTHDGLHHIARAYDAISTFNEGHFPLRWAGSLNYGCGIPIFNFFYPFLYYLIIIFNKFSFDVVFSIKLISLLSLMVGSIFFYLWMSVEAESKISAFGGALLYLFAPYRFSLILVRGSPEYLAYAILPLVLFFYSLAFKNIKTKWLLLYLFFASFFGGLLSISHNFTVMFLMPIILLYLIIKIIKYKTLGISKFFLILFSYLSIFGLGAFFIFPALFEGRYTQIGLNADIVYSEHFPTLHQLFVSKWDYFYSAGGTEFDGMSFMLGYAQWFVLVLFLIWITISLWKMVRKIPLGKYSIWIIFFGLGSVLSVFLMLEKSIFVWEAISLLQQIQFPWRILGIAVFSISVLFSFLLRDVRRSVAIVVLIIVSLLAILGNRNHLLPMPVSDDDVWMFQDFEKFHYHRFSTTTMGDDIVARNAIGRCWFTDSEITYLGKKLEYQVVEKKNISGTIRFNIKERKEVGNFVLKLGYFPDAYTLNLNGEDVSIQDCEGKVCIPANTAKEGYNIISWKIIQTPTQKIFNAVTVITLVIWVLFLVIYYLGISKDRKRLVRFFVTLFVIVVYCVIRFYNLPKKFGFDWDAERDANVIKDILIGKFTLIGPRVLGPSGFFLPPYFYYMLAPFYWVSRLDPIAILYFLYFYNALFLVVALVVLSNLFSHKFALIFIALLACVPYMISMDTVAWNPVMIPIVFLGFIYLLHKYDVSKKFKWLFFSAMCFSFGVGFHIQFVFYGVLFLPFLLKKGAKIYNLLLIVLGAIIPFLPLFLFDLRHSFVNTRLIFDMLGVLGERSVYQILSVWSNFLSRVFVLNLANTHGIIFYFAFVLLFGFFTYITKKWKNRLWIGLFLVWLIFPLGFYIYGRRPSEYYFNFLIPIIVLVVASLINDLVSYRRFVPKIIGLIAFVAILYFYFPKAIKETEYISPKSYYNKEKAVAFLKSLTVDSPPFNLSYSVTLGEDVGFRYIVNRKNILYSGKDTDTLIQLTYPSNTAKDTFSIGVYGIIVPATWLNESIQLK